MHLRPRTLIIRPPNNNTHSLLVGMNECMMYSWAWHLLPFRLLLFDLDDYYLRVEF